MSPETTQNVARDRKMFANGFMVKLKECETAHCLLRASPAFLEQLWNQDLVIFNPKLTQNVPKIIQNVLKPTQNVPPSQEMFISGCMVDLEAIQGGGMWLWASRAIMKLWDQDLVFLDSKCSLTVELR